MLDIYQALGSNVRKMRTQLDISQEELADRMGMDVRSVIAIETGKRNPTLKTIYCLSHALKVPSSRLLSF